MKGYECCGPLVQFQFVSRSNLIFLDGLCPQTVVRPRFHQGPDAVPTPPLTLRLTHSEEAWELVNKLDGST